MPDILLHLLLPILSSLLYAGLSIYFWHTRWRVGQHSPEAHPSSLSGQAWAHAAIVLALVLQGLDLHGNLFGAGSMRFSFSLALSLMLWLAVLIFWLESFFAKVDGLQPFVLPFAATCALLPLLFPQTHVIAHADSWGFRLHFIAAMLAYSLFTLSALHAVFMGIVERKLHHKELNKYFSSLPPILSMETLLFRMISIAFALLTVALGSGVLFSEAIFGKPMSLDHKTVFAFASWSIFAALLLGRQIYGWRGRIALRWTMTGFLFLMLAYVGSRFVSEILLGRI